MIVLDPSIFIQSSPFVKTYSLKEFFELPEPKDNSKMELIQGVLYMSPMLDWRHSETIENIDSIRKTVEVRKIKTENGIASLFTRETMYFIQMSFQT